MDKELWSNLPFQYRRKFLREYPEVLDALADAYHKGWRTIDLSRATGLSGQTLANWKLKAIGLKFHSPEMKDLRDQLIETFSEDPPQHY